jgi:hypothetical protein
MLDWYILYKLAVKYKLKNFYMKALLFPVLCVVAFIIACNTSTQHTETGTASDTSAKAPDTTLVNKPDTVHKIDTVTSLGDIEEATAYFKAPNGKYYLVTSGTEDDMEEVPDSGMTTMNENPPCNSDRFDGVDRKAAKLSISTANIKQFSNLAAFMQTLIPDEEVEDHATISTGSSSQRISIEKRNVHIKKAWLFTFKRESDEDYHVIIGTTQDKATAEFFNAEISGLPATSGTTKNKLSKVRNDFEDFFGIADKCISAYRKTFMDDPIEIELKGSLFFDQLHFRHHSAVGPAAARGESYWEIHPVTFIKFK